MKYFATADEHYGHDNVHGGIIKMCNRPFASLAEMEEAFIKNHNTLVTSEDFTIHTGDMFWKSVDIGHAMSIMSQLNGAHGLVLGNHDEVAKKLQVEFHPFAWVKDVYQLCIKGIPPIWFSHYAHRVWPASHKGSYHVFGHTHNVLPDHRCSHDVGVDANNFFPVSVNDLHVYMQDKGKIPPDEVEQDMLDHPWEAKPKFPEGD